MNRHCHSSVETIWSVVNQGVGSITSCNTPPVCKGYFDILNHWLASAQSHTQTRERFMLIFMPNPIAAEFWNRWNISAASNQSRWPTPYFGYRGYGNSNISSKILLCVTVTAIAAFSWRPFYDRFILAEIALHFMCRQEMIKSMAIVIVLQFMYRFKTKPIGTNVWFAWFLCTSSSIKLR